ncbi:DUF2252 domain-containing protein [soil metagenome]
MKPPSVEERPGQLSARQKLKMARSAHAYVRGSTTRFYDWLERSSTRDLPVGPPVWICGDCHVGNLGPVANAKGEIAIQIRDLDQTVIGNPAHDVIRLALSLASAVRGSDLPGVTTARVLEQVVEGYQAALSPERDNGDSSEPEAVREALHAALKRDWRHLARERIVDTKPTIPLGRKFWPLTPEERLALSDMVATNELRTLATALHSRPSEGAVEFLDAAFWVKGCSSLGRLRYAVLIAIGEGKKRQLSLIDVKEAIKPAAPRAEDAKMPRDNGRRVVEGARHLSPYLGDRMTAGRVLDKAVFVRELLPQDLKLEFESLTPAEAISAARFLAGVVGRAHGRQMDQDTRARWTTELDRNRSKSLDAPSWLWTSVVELLASHETAYLEHCRRYAEVAA